MFRKSRVVYQPVRSECRFSFDKDFTSTNFLDLLNVWDARFGDNA